MRRLAQRLITFHWSTTLILMGLLALGFGLLTINLYALLKANLTLIATHGAMALVDGALGQLAELIVTGYLAVACYVGIKACEKMLVEWLLA